MLRIKFGVSLFVLGIFVVAHADFSAFLARGDSHTWNSLVYGENLIPAEFDSAIPQLGSTAAIKSEFQSLLADEDLLKRIYSNYKLEFAEHINKVPFLVAKLNEPGRENVLKQTLLTIAEHNLGALNGMTTYSQGVNAFSHLTPEEFRVQFASGGIAPSVSQIDPPSGQLSLGQAPSSKNWTAEGKVTSVKSQLGCGSCYAFAGIASLESQCIIRYNANLDLAEQEIVDCTSNGCNGGNQDNVYNYETQNGLSQEYQYPYTAQKGSCKAASTTNRLRIAPINSTWLTQGDENNLANNINQYGPATTVLNAGGWSNYKTGVFQGGCGSSLDGQNNHVVLITGYTPNTWSIKNSWGTSWGMQGYILLQRGSNQCGVATWAGVITSMAGK